jgi:hypothetical protein
VVDHLSSTHEALGSISSAEKNPTQLTYGVSLYATVMVCYG